jgi:AGZA family xanthine/uracil permease-like MFS transporter
VEGAGAVVGGATSSSSHTVFFESGAGIVVGARTGLANIVTGALFLAAVFISPVASIVPTEVAAAALVVVGAMMVSHLRHIDISEFSVALPVVLTVAVMPFSYSIANGIGVGFIAWIVMRSAAGKIREISPLLWIVALGFVVYFARAGVESLIGM